MNVRPQPTKYSRTVIRRIRELRIGRRWTTQYLADLVTAQGCPMSRAVLAKIELGVRDHVTVDELYAFASAFGVPADELANDGPTCPTCEDRPPAGFRCVACGCQTDPIDTAAGRRRSRKGGD